MYISRNYAKPSPTAIRLSRDFKVLPYMAERYIKMLGVEGAIMLLKSIQKPPEKAIRCNTLKISPEELERRLSRKNFVLKNIPWTRTGYWVEGGQYPLGATLEYLMGYYYVQSAASMIPPIVLNPSPRDTVLDMCAAPGGKTCHLADLMENKGVIVAVEKSRDRIRALRSNINRLGVRNVLMVRMDVLKLATKFRERFDKVLLDAPCSGEGLLAINHSRRTCRSLDDIFKMQKLQVELLRTAIKLVLNGGTIVYSTCSIAPEENEFVVNQVLNYGVKIEEIHSPIAGDPGFTEIFGVKLSKDLSKCLRLYPHKHGTLGFFVCKLIKES